MGIKENRRKYELKSKYRLTPEQHDRMYHIQGGCCAICDKHEKETREILQVDHDHVTGRIRGLLCRNCNLKLGMLEQAGDVSTFMTLVHLYLENPPAQ